MPSVTTTAGPEAVATAGETDTNPARGLALVTLAPTAGAAASTFAPLSLAANPTLQGITAEAFDSFNVHRAYMDPSWGRQWQDVLSEPGSGAILALRSDPSMQLVQWADLIKFSYKGQLAWTMLAEKQVIIVSDPAEEANETIGWTGRGHVAILEEALVYPSKGPGFVPIEDNRLFNWTSPSYDDTAWGFAKELEQVGPSRTNWAGVTQNPPAADGMPDDAAWVLWADPFTYVTADPGQCFFRSLFTVPADGNYILSLIMDDWGQVFLDGSKLADVQEDYIRATTMAVQLSAGTHLLAANTINYFLADPAHNPGGWAWTVSSDGGNGRAGPTVAVSDGTTKIVAYVDQPPGMTPGRVLRLVLEEGVARGCWNYATSFGVFPTSFSDTLDSGGAPWPVVADIATRVGNDTLSFLRELAGTYIDFAMGPDDYTLHAWNIGTRGDPRDAVLLLPSAPDDPTSGNLTKLVLTNTL